jgi:hypothetical protein
VRTLYGKEARDQRKVEAEKKGIFGKKGTWRRIK